MLWFDKKKSSHIWAIVNKNKLQIITIMTLLNQNLTILLFTLPTYYYIITYPREKSEIFEMHSYTFFSHTTTFAFWKIYSQIAFIKNKNNKKRKLMALMKSWLMFLKPQKVSVMLKKFTRKPILLKFPQWLYCQDQYQTHIWEVFQLVLQM